MCALFERTITNTLQVLTTFVVVVMGVGCQDFRDCSEEDISAAEALPQYLSQTGLYEDIGTGVLNEEAISFTPQFPLWTDGAGKRRWLLLPAGEQVNTADVENWDFPVGTQFFKEFERDGVRVETRMNMRTTSGWAAVTYRWNNSGDDAVRQLQGIENASGTDHDIPSAGECLACHGGRENFTLGFSATQLDVDSRMRLYADGVLSQPVETTTAVSQTFNDGLGVLHGNCSHCHNSNRSALSLATVCYDPSANEDDDDPLDFSLPSDLQSIEDAPALRTGRWQLGGPHDSEVLNRMSTRNLSSRNPSMPPLGTEVVDDEGLAAVEAFIMALSEQGL